VSPLVHQDILNSDVGGFYFQGIAITSGVFQLWRAAGIVTNVDMQCASSASLTGVVISMLGSYFHFHISYYPGLASPVYRKFKSLCLHHLSLLFGLGSIAWAAHQYHIAGPINRLLDSGITPASMGSPQDLTLAQGGPQPAHHFYVGVLFILAGLIALALRPGRKRTGWGTPRTRLSSSMIGTQAYNSWHAQLSINLAVTATLSIVFAHHQAAMQPYPYYASDYPAVLSSFCHHIWLGSFLICGSACHASIFMIRDYSTFNIFASDLPSIILKHRDLIIGHLIWVVLALGLHSFGIYVHNDTLQALYRPEDIFGDNSIQLKPVFATWMQGMTGKIGFDIEILDGKLIRMTQELGSADFMVHHIHAFTIHQTLLILCKAVLYARSSRLLSDKLELGFRYPCDGPGRGGTCQISAWDHIYLALFWMYNSSSPVLFHYFWKMQSDVWAFMSDANTSKITEITSHDFSLNGTSINAWLRNFLWSGAGQVIQTYATSISAYGLIFLFAHFVWAFSLMFLYSGRGYWQELIESILWCHHKLGVVPVIQPRALSISQGRAVGLTHYVLGGIFCTGAFFVSRVILLSS
jgi:photosystem I P700 chlorophyll a apoprotein A1